MTDHDRLTIHNVREQIVGIDAHVPLLDGSHRQYVFFDNAASTPALRPVYDKVNEFMTWYSSVHRGTGFKSQIATEAYYELARDLVGCFVGADPETNTVIFGKNATEAINKLARRYPLEPDHAGEAVVLCSLMEHHSNDLPWRQQARVYHIAVNDDGSLDEDDFDRLLRQHAGRVKLVAVSGAQNVTGCLNPIHRLAEKSHAVGAKIVVDAAQLAPHRAINMRPDDDPGHLDFVAIAAHKMYAPYGTGALIGPTSVFAEGTPDLVGGGTVDLVTVDDVRWAGPPSRDEAGSPNVVGAVAMAQAILSLQTIGMEALAQHEAELTAHALRRLREIDGLELYGLTSPHRCFCAHPYILRLLKVSGHDALRHQQDIVNGTRVGLPGLVRVSFGCYNTTEEVDHLVETLTRIAAGDIRGDYEQDPASGAYWPRDFQPGYERYFALQAGLAARSRKATMPRCGV
jgi:selenocysteine lyase/cysteine desulfurase